MRNFSGLFQGLLLAVGILMGETVHAKVWRVNNTPGVSANFADFNLAVTAAATGDTIYLEGSSNAYSGQVTKPLVVIGPGYFLSGPSANPGLQANTLPATISLNIDSTASGSQFIGLTGSFNPSGGADNVTIMRCLINSLSTFSSGNFSDWKVRQCYFNGGSLAIYSATTNWQITNCIFFGTGFDLSAGTNLLFRNNTLYAVNVRANGAYIANNIFSGNCGVADALNSTIRYNLASRNILPPGNSNQNNIPESSLTLGTSNADNQYQQPAGSPALGAGEPINGITPDAGAFGTATPYRLSGIPPIPTIYSLTVPSSIPTTATTITISFSTRSNN